MQALQFLNQVGERAGILLSIHYAKVTLKLARGRRIGHLSHFGDVAPGFILNLEETLSLLSLVSEIHRDCFASKSPGKGCAA